MSPAGNLEAPICAVRHPAIDVPEDEALGNAFLIAAAPDLLEALTDYMAAFGQGLESHGIPFGDQQQRADILARAAIAKATWSQS